VRSSPPVDVLDAANTTEHVVAEVVVVGDHVHGRPADRRIDVASPMHKQNNWRDGRNSRLLLGQIDHRSTDSAKRLPNSSARRSAGHDDSGFEGNEEPRAEGN